MKLRLRFSKHGMMRYIGHLDIMRYFQKAMRRAEIPIKYSEGFSPHKIMSFSAPLGLGLESDAEYVDIVLTEETADPEDIMRRLNAVMCPGIAILNAVRISDTAKKSMAVVESAEYDVFWPDGTDREQLRAAAEALMNRDMIPEERPSGKTGELKTRNIRPLIYRLEVREDRLHMHVAQGSTDNLKPDVVLRALGLENIGFSINRTEVYGPDGVPLDRLL